MTRKIVVRLFCALSLLSSTLLVAQDESARGRVRAAQARYYTPTVSGLKGFHCDAGIDWKQWWYRVTGKEAPSDNPWLKYAQTVQLSIDDDLRGQGSLAWIGKNNPPAGLEGAQKQTKEGLQAWVSVFFSSWNTFMDSGLLRLDNTVVVTKSGEGVHVSGIWRGINMDEEFDKNMLLTQVAVETPGIKAVEMPTFTETEDGLIVSGLVAKIHQPPSAPQIEMDYRVDYAKVDTFQIPSHVRLEKKNVGIVEFDLSNCKVSVADWAKKQ